MKLNTMHGLSAVRVAVLALCTAALGTTAMMAQDTPPAGPPPGQGGPGGLGRGGMGGPEQQERQLAMMTRQLNLTPDQVSAIKAIQADGRKQMMALRDDTTVTGPDRRTKMMAMRDAEQAKIKATLTDDQKTKYDAMMAQQRERRENGGGGNGGPPPPPPPPPATL